MAIDGMHLLLSAAIRALALGVVAFLGLRIFPHGSPAARHATWTVVLIGMLLEIPLGALPATIALKILPSVATPTGELEAKWLRPSLTGSIKLPRALAPPAYANTEPRSRRQSSTALVCGAYLTVSILLFVRIVLGLWGLRGILREAKAVPCLGRGVFESDLMTSPGSVGCFRPSILLPRAWRDWDGVKLRAVLAHETAHIRRRDWPIRVAAQVNVCIFWFHPLAWWIDRELAGLAEEAADDLAVSEMEDKEEYAATLLDIALEAAAHRRLFGWGLSWMASASNAVQRVNRILSRRPVPKPFGGLAWATLLAFGLPAIYLSSAVKLASASRDSRPFHQGALHSTAESGVIVAISVQGNPDIPTDAVWAQLSIHVGDLYERASIERTLKSLWDTGFFENVRYEREQMPKGWAIHIYVKERPSMQQDTVQRAPPKSSTRHIAQEGPDPLRTSRLPMARQEYTPITMCILVDNSGSMAEHRAEVETAALALIKASKPQDEVCIVHFNDETFGGLPDSKDFTSDVKEMEEAVRHIDSRGGSAMRDAVQKSIDQVQQTANHHQRILVLVTNGTDTSSVVTQDELLDKIRISGVRVYSIGLLSPELGQAAAARVALGKIAEASRAQDFYPKDVTEVERIAPAIADQARSQ